MKKIFLLLFLFILFLGCLEEPEENEEDDKDIIILINKDSYTGNSVWGINGEGSKIEPVQSFQLSSDSTCSKIALHINNSVNPSSTYTIRIETDNSGEPSGTLADSNAEKTFSYSDISVGGWFKIIFDNSFTLTSSTVYWIVCRTDESGGSEKCFYLSRNNNCYSDGALGTYYNGTLGAFGSADLFFIIYQ